MQSLSIFLDITKVADFRLKIVDNRKTQEVCHVLRYFNFEPSFKLRWCCARDIFGSQIPVADSSY